MSKDLHFNLSEEYVLKRQKISLKEQREYEQKKQDETRRGFKKSK